MYSFFLGHPVLFWWVRILKYRASKLLIGLALTKITIFSQILSSNCILFSHLLTAPALKVRPIPKLLIGDKLQSYIIHAVCPTFI